MVSRATQAVRGRKGYASMGKLAASVLLIAIGVWWAVRMSSVMSDGQKMAAIDGAPIGGQSVLLRWLEGIAILRLPSLTLPDVRKRRVFDVLSRLWRSP